MHYFYTLVTVKLAVDKSLTITLRTYNQALYCLAGSIMHCSIRPQQISHYKQLPLDAQKRYRNKADVEFIQCHFVIAFSCIYKLCVGLYFCKVYFKPLLFLLDVELYEIWPPIGIHAVNPWAIPLLGSCVLLASGFVLTLAVIIR